MCTEHNDLELPTLPMLQGAPVCSGSSEGPHPTPQSWPMDPSKTCQDPKRRQRDPWSLRLHSSTPIPPPPAAFSAPDPDPLRPLQQLPAGRSIRASFGAAKTVGIWGRDRSALMETQIRIPQSYYALSPVSHAGGRPLWVQAKQTGLLTVASGAE